MKNIISYSLYGSQSIYWYGALENIDLAQRYYPDYTIRFYVDNNSNKKMFRILERECTKSLSKIELSLMDSSKKHSGMLWRFLVAEDPDVDIILFRDTDSRISLREQILVNEWLDSDKNFHIIRDHPKHTKKIMAGLCGCRNGVLSNIGLKAKIMKDINFEKGYGYDEKFLGDVIYPIIQNTAFEHSSNNIVFANETHKIPPHSGKNFLGQKINRSFP